MYLPASRSAKTTPCSSCRMSSSRRISLGSPPRHSSAACRSLARTIGACAPANRCCTESSDLANVDFSTARVTRRRASHRSLLSTTTRLRPVCCCLAAGGNRTRTLGLISDCAARSSEDKGPENKSLKFLITPYLQPSSHGMKQEHVAVSASLNDGAQHGAISKGAQRAPV